MYDLFNNLDFDSKYLYTFSYSKFLDEMIKGKCNDLIDVIWAEDIPNGAIVLNGYVSDVKGEIYIMSPSWCDKWILKDNHDMELKKIENDRQQEGNLYQTKINELEKTIELLKNKLKGSDE